MITAGRRLLVLGAFDGRLPVDIVRLLAGVVGGFDDQP